MGPKRSARITDEQKLILIEFLEQNRALISGNTSPTFTSADKARLWQEAADILNSSGCGPSKDADSWRGCWGDLKSNVKKRLQLYQRGIKGTGGGNYEKFPLKEYEERVFALMGKSTVFGLEGPLESNATNMPPEPVVCPRNADLPLLISRAISIEEVQLPNDQPFPITLHVDHSERSSVSEPASLQNIWKPANMAQIIGDRVVSRDQPDTETVLVSHPASPRTSTTQTNTSVKRGQNQIDNVPESQQIIVAASTSSSSNSGNPGILTENQENTHPTPACRRIGLFPGRTKKNVKRFNTRGQELEKATQNVGEFASAQARLATATEQLAEMKKEMLAVKKAKLAIEERRVAAEEKIAACLEIIIQKHL